MFFMKSECTNSFKVHIFTCQYINFFIIQKHRFTSMTDPKNSLSRDNGSLVTQQHQPLLCQPPHCSWNRRSTIDAQWRKGKSKGQIAMKVGEWKTSTTMEVGVDRMTVVVRAEEGLVSQREGEMGKKGSREHWGRKVFEKMKLRKGKPNF